MGRATFNDSRIGVVFLLLGALLRVIYVLSLEISEPIRGDAASYLLYALNLTEYGTFSRDRGVPPIPDSYWAPGYPTFLAVCFNFSSFFKLDFYYVVLIVQGMLGGAISWLTYTTGRNFLSKGYAVLAATLVVISPHLMSLSGYFLTETLLTLLLLAGIYFFYMARKREISVGWWFLSGAAFGSAYLTNPVVLLVPFLFFASHICFSKEEKKDHILHNRSSIFLLVFIAFIVSWAVRDIISVPEDKGSTAGRAFDNLVIGSHKNYHETWRANPRDPSNPADIDINTYKDDQFGFITELTNRVVAAPGHYLSWYFFGKPAELWGWDILVGDGDIYVFPVDASLYHKSKVALVSLVLMKNTHHIWLSLAVIGCFFVFKERDKNLRFFVGSMYLCLISVSAIYVLLHTDGRYSIPLRPEMYLCAAYGLQKLFWWVREKNERQERFVKSSS